MDEARLDSQLKERYYFVDSVRGILIAGVVLYHAFFDYAAVFGISSSILPYMPVIYAVRDIGCFLFVFIAGISVHFGKKRLKRSLLIFGCGAAVSVVTHIFVPDMAVFFGVLSFFGTAGLIMIPLERLLKKVPALSGLIISLLLFFAVFNVFKGYLGWGKYSISLPEEMYANTLTAVIGFPPPSFESADYFPVFPWIFAYISGYYLWSVVSHGEAILRFCKKKLPFFAAAGKYTLWIYLAHQPILYGLTLLVYKLICITSEK